MREAATWRQLDNVARALFLFDCAARAGGNQALACQSTSCQCTHMPPSPPPPPPHLTPDNAPSTIMHSRGGRRREECKAIMTTVYYKNWFSPYEKTTLVFIDRWTSCTFIGCGARLRSVFHRWHDAISVCVVRGTTLLIFFFKPRELMMKEDKERISDRGEHKLLFDH